MLPAEATFHPRTLVGQSSPTMLQTLLDLLELYDSGDTDREKWIQLIESDALSLCHFASTSDSPSLTDWADPFSIEDFQHQLLTIANEISVQDSSRVETHHNNLIVSLLSAALSGYLQLPDGRKAALVGLLAGMPYQSNEFDIADALKHFDRDLAHLEDTNLFTRLIAVAYQLVTAPGPETTATGAALLGMSEASLAGILEGVLEEASWDLDQAELRRAFEEQLATLNLKTSFALLLRTLGPEKAFKQLALSLFGIDTIRVFMLKGSGWTDGEFELTGRHSMIVAASRDAMSVSTLAHTMTVIDEKLLAAMNTPEALAVPVVAETVAVLLLGMDKNKLVEIANNQDVLNRFTDVASFALNEYRENEELVNRATLDAAAKEIIHEANNPLSTIQNYLKVLSLQLEPGHDAQETLRTISEELFRASAILERFRQVGEPIQTRARYCNVNRALTRQIDLFDKAHDDIRFSIELDELDPIAAIDAGDLTQIVSNLVKNAIEACTAGDAIHVASLANINQGRMTYVEITVKDTGPGISDSIADIFDRGETTKDGDNRGQGLAIVKDLANKSHSLISYRTSSAGTEFRITIPQFKNNAGKQS